MSDESLAELSMRVAKAKGWKIWEDPVTKWMMRDGTLTNVFWKDPATGDFAYPPNFTDPARLFELEGECQRAGWSFDYATNDPDWGWVAMNARKPGVGYKFPATNEGRAQLVMTVWLAAYPAPSQVDGKGRTSM